MAKNRNSSPKCFSPGHANVDLRGGLKSYGKWRLEWFSFPSVTAWFFSRKKTFSVWRESQKRHFLATFEPFFQAAALSRVLNHFVSTEQRFLLAELSNSGEIVISHIWPAVSYANAYNFEMPLSRFYDTSWKKKIIHFEGRIESVSTMLEKAAFLHHLRAPNAYFLLWPFGKRFCHCFGMRNMQSHSAGFKNYIGSQITQTMSLNPEIGAFCFVGHLDPKCEERLRFPSTPPSAESTQIAKESPVILPRKKNPGRMNGRKSSS